MPIKRFTVKEIAIMPDEAHWLYKFNIGTSALYGEGRYPEPLEVFSSSGKFTCDDPRFLDAINRALDMNARPATEQEIQMVVKAGYNVR